MNNSKKIKLFFSITAIVAVLFSACKKNDPGKSIVEMLRHRWSFQKEYHHENYGGVDYADTLIGVVGEYADFRDDGKLYYNVNGQSDTSTYSIVSNDRIALIHYNNAVIYKDTAHIIILNDTELQLYFKKFDPAPDYYEYTDYYTR